MDFEADPINKLKTLIIKTSLFVFNINLIFLYNAIKILQTNGFRRGS